MKLPPRKLHQCGKDLQLSRCCQPSNSFPQSSPIGAQYIKSILQKNCYDLAFRVLISCIFKQDCPRKSAHTSAADLQRRSFDSPDQQIGRILERGVQWNQTESPEMWGKDPQEIWGNTRFLVGNRRKNGWLPFSVALERRERERASAVSSLNHAFLSLTFACGERSRDLSIASRHRGHGEEKQQGRLVACNCKHRL